MNYIDKIRLVIADKDKSDFHDSEIIEFYTEGGNSINYTVCRLTKILMMRLRKQILESSDTGSEKEKLASLNDRMKLLKEIYNNYKSYLEAENNNSTGIYIETTKPTIAGGDV